MAASERAAQAAQDIIGRVSGARPLWSVAGTAEHGMAAARWRFERLPAIEAQLPCCVLAYRASGSAWVTHVLHGQRVRRRLAVGTVSFVRDNRRAPWSVDGPFEVIHLYLEPSAVARVAGEQLELGGPAQIDDFFGVDDPWLAGYFQMLMSEFETRDASDGRGDPLLLDESEHIVVRHLLRRHGAGEGRPEASRTAGVNPLRPALMRRAEEYIEANLAGDISLGLLAKLCCMSVDHFLRSFRAASGLTPYQYVLERRLLAAAVLLRASEAPVAKVASACGFGSASHFSVQFHARFAVSPTRYRKSG